MLDKNRLNNLYSKYNRREFVHPDPLEFLYNYENTADREIVALTASSLAYGKVYQILKSVNWVLSRMNPSPRIFVEQSSAFVMKKTFSGFKHRFAGDMDLVGLLLGVKGVLKEFNSLGDCFLSGYKITDSTLIPALSRFVENISKKGKGTNLLPHPSKGSACKRLNLFLRWMLRSDDVDPGGWNGVSKSKLVVPLDTHMHAIGLKFGLTKRKQADFKTALEITSSFAKVSPEDPVKYDFALTRFGIRDELHLGML